MRQIEKEENYVDYILEVTSRLLAVDSPSGYTRQAAEFVRNEFLSLGYRPEMTKKGGILVNLGGRDTSDGILLEAHMDTLGAMVAEVKPDGRLRLTNIGGLNPNNVEGENCRVYTREGDVYDGTFQLVNASIHVNGKYDEIKRGFDTMELVLDERTQSVEETKKLGIARGDIVCFDPRTRITESGYIKSRFLDDKLSVGILLGFARYLQEENICQERAVYVHITSYEEVGHGGAASVPEGITEVLSVDMGCVGEGLECREHQVSICAKDSGGPYDYETVSGLISAAREMGADYAVDIYPHYGSDAEATLRAGYDVRHGLIGAGVYASHGYERSHRDGVKHTWRVLIGYCCGSEA